MKKLCEDMAMSMYREGRLDQEIAEAIGYSRVSVTNWRKSRGLPPNRRRRPEKMLDAYKAAMPLERVQELARAEKDGRLVVQKPPFPGDTIWIIERDEYEEPIEISGYMFFAFVGRAAIVSSFINDSETLDETVEYHIDETMNNFDTDLSVFPKNDCYLTREEAEAALKKREEAVQ